MSTKLTDRSKIPAILKEMTLEEKALLLVGKTNFTTRDFEKYGIKECRVLDGGTGVNLFQHYGSLMVRAKLRDPEHNDVSSASGVNNSVMLMHMLPKERKGEELQPFEKEARRIINEELEAEGLTHEFPGCFPPGMMLGATWNPETVYRCASAVAKEMDSFSVDMVLGSPNVNIHRDPRNGRVFEGYSEDPFVTAKLAPEFVKGTQDEGLIADVKHFAANNQESFRMKGNEIISQRALQEIYFPGFKACVQESKVKSVMDAYNKINGVACSQNKWLLDDMLRKEWGFDGLVISDWNAVYDRAEALKAGNDLQMPGPRPVQPILDAIAEGRLTEADLDKAATRMMEMLLQMPTQKGHKRPPIDREYSRNAAYEGAKEGMVLLKNNGRLLPLSEKKKISFIGEGCRQFTESGGGSAMVYTEQSTSLLECTEKRIGKDKVTFGKIAKDSDVVIITGRAWGQEGNDRAAMDLDAADKAMLLKAVKQAKKLGKKIIVILNVAGPVDMTEYIDDVDAVLCVFLPGMEGGHACADLLFGDINPSGKLTITFPKHYRDCPSYGQFPGNKGEILYGEGIYVGYRWYDLKGIEPLFPFGFGLSYSKFKLSELKLDKTEMDLAKNDSITVSCKVKNTSKVDGKEVVQLYIHDPKSALAKPFKELKGFQKVFVKAGEEQTVSIKVSAEDLKCYDVDLCAWAAEPGKYEIWVGNSSDNLTLKAEFVAKCADSPYNYNENTALCTVFADERAKDILVGEIVKAGFPANAASDALYYFPHRTLKAFIKMLAGKLKEKTAEQQQEWTDSVIAKLHALDISCLG